MILIITNVYIIVSLHWVFNMKKMVKYGFSPSIFSENWN